MNSLLNILFITAFPPNQKTAGQDYSRRLLDDLASRGHKISLIYAEYPSHEVELSPQIEVLAKITPSLKNCKNLPLLNPFFTKRFDKNILSLIQKIASDFDMLYFDFSQVHVYSLFVEHQNKVLMCHDVIFQKFTRKNRIFLPWIKFTEKKILKSAGKILTACKKDSELLKNQYNLESIFVNQYLKNGKFDYKLLNSSILNNTFCFYGAWNRTENSECLEWFLKNVSKKVNPSLKFVVIGGGMSENLQKKLENYKNFSYLGFVENPIVEVAKCQALIAPLSKGAGVKVKVIDALSSGTKVIGTDVAFEGIEDNLKNPLFVKICSPQKKDSVLQICKILNNWQNIEINQKQLSATEFFERYNKNHFADRI